MSGKNVKFRVSLYLQLQSTSPWLFAFDRIIDSGDRKKDFYKAKRIPVQLLQGISQQSPSTNQLKHRRAFHCLQAKSLERDVNRPINERLILVNRQLNLRGSSLILYLTRTSSGRTSGFRPFRSPENRCLIVHFGSLRVFRG